MAQLQMKVVENPKKRESMVLMQKAHDFFHVGKLLSQVKLSDGMVDDVEEPSDIEKLINIGLVPKINLNVVKDTDVMEAVEAYTNVLV
ncbi:hypothetical protein [Candidatus Enterovibrio altilux]|uniref:Uncharacterized protein n=2 Tax=Candidatus Enterovibrio altilux TaxID=1927128 RepID=A0A291B854_9GAMM|nr:hypothetical protein [Candidatus Enterovibrio luxaltus]ATF09181.1 hypothetical protein BTN50_0663 [Candidatus Enterovibrio luxaltus]